VPLDLQQNVPPAPLTTLELGGPARALARLSSEQELPEALARARAARMPLRVLGGGSNVVFADAGYEGLILQMAIRGVSRRREGERILVEAAAGEPWDRFVEQTVQEGLAGLECLSGIPGQVGATPIQNVGAYGQEVSDTLHSMRVMRQEDGLIERWGAERAELGYRTSLFKRHPGAWIVLSVTFALRPGGAPTLRYPELRRALPAGADLRATRASILALRRAKSMILDPADENRRSAGSFFTNPIVSEAEAEAVIARALSASLVDDPSELPRYPAGPGRIKLAAGWLIERSGLSKGMRRGAFGLSSRHALALVHHGGGTSAGLLAFARDVQDAVLERFGLALELEPELLGFSEPPIG